MITKVKSLLIGDYKPLINSYWFWADQFVMINRITNSEYWLLNNFIDLWCDKQMLPGGIFFSGKGYRNKMVEFYDCPFLEMQKIAFDEDKRIFGYGIIEFAKEFIEQGNFILLMVDRFFISEYGFKNSNNHEILIHGYDDKSEKFMFCDNNKNGKFEMNLSCTYSELQSAYMEFKYFKDEPDFNTSIFLFRPREDDSYSVDIQKIKKSLSQYLTPDIDPTLNEIHGIKIYEALIGYFSDALLTDKLNLDPRGLCVLYDHKKAMLYRLIELKKYIKICDNYIKAYENIVQKSNVLLNLFLKYSVKGEKCILEKCISYLKEIYTEEYSLLKKLL